VGAAGAMDAFVGAVAASKMPGLSSRTRNKNKRRMAFP